MFIIFTIFYLFILGIESVIVIVFALALELMIFIFLRYFIRIDDKKFILAPPTSTVVWFHKYTRSTPIVKCKLNLD